MNDLDRLVADALSSHVAGVEPPAAGLDHLRDAVRRQRRRRRTAAALAAAALVIALGGIVALALIDRPGADPVITDAPPSTPQDRIPPSSTSTAQTSTTRVTPGPATAGDEELVGHFLQFAASPGPETFARLPLADQVALGLGGDLRAVRNQSELADPDAWVLDLDLFRARVGRASALELAADAGDTVVSVGDHPHCASPPQPVPTEVADLRHISVQPRPDSIDSCLAWWTVDLFVTVDGEIAAVTIDLWEP